MASKDEVAAFLDELHVKMKVFGILFRDDRGVNDQALAELEISSARRVEIIRTLTVEDFSERLTDTLNNLGYMWVFGKNVKGKEVYIKVTVLRNNAICISFHVAKYPMNYPFKQ